MEEPLGAKCLAFCCGCVFFVILILVVEEFVNKYVYIEDLW